MIAQANQALTMGCRAKTSLWFGLPLTPEGDSCREFVVGGTTPGGIKLQLAMAQGTSGQGILEGIGPLPTAADNRHVGGLFRQQALGHGFTVRQRSR